MKVSDSIAETLQQQGGSGVLETAEDGAVSARINVPRRGKPLRFDFMHRTDYLLPLEATGKCCVDGLARLLGQTEDAPYH